MDYICRRITADDIAIVMDMNRNFREGFISKDSAKKFLISENNIIFAAVKENVIIGFAYGYVLHRLDNKGDMLYIHEVGVMEEYQKQGVGYKMMTELKAWCKENGICKYFLSCYQNNTGANKLYKKLGGIVSNESQGNDTGYTFIIS